MQAFQGAVGHAGEPALGGRLWRCVVMRWMQSDACMMNSGNSSLGNHGAIQIQEAGVRIPGDDAGMVSSGPSEQLQDSQDCRADKRLPAIRATSF